MVQTLIEKCKTQRKLNQENGEGKESEDLHLNVSREPIRAFLLGQRTTVEGQKESLSETADRLLKELIAEVDGDKTPAAQVPVVKT